MKVRRRQEGDVQELMGLLALTQRESGYPVDAALVRPDWLVAAGELDAWVAVRDGRPSAHAALHRPHGVSISVWEAATGRPESELVVVSRLFSRVRGGGTELLRTAVASAQALGRTPVLEVHHESPAYPFYLRRGWRLAGEVEQNWGRVPVRVAALVFGAQPEHAP